MAGNPFAYAADEPLDFIDPTGHYIVPPGGAYGAGTTQRVGNGATSESNYIADETTARIVEHAVITAPNDAARAAAAHAAVARVEAEQATAHRAAVAAAARAARAAATQRAARALRIRREATSEAAGKSLARWLFGRSPMSEAVDLDGGKNITPPGEDLGNDIEFIPVGDQGVEALVNPGHEGPNNDIYINPGHQGPGSEILGNPGSDQGTIINADDPGTDQPQDGLEEGSGQLSLFDEQQFRVSNRGSGGKAFASANGTQTMSGWADPVPEGISRVSPNDVLELQQQMGFPARQAGALDNGNPGAYFASHAERQMALLEPNAPIDVSSGMCSDCQSFFQALATYRGVSQQVTDPDGTRIFNP